MKRAASILVALTLVTAASSLAQANDDDFAKAEALNKEGKVLIKQLELEAAAQKFREALELSDDPRFAFNLCFTLEKQNKLQEAKDACEEVTASRNKRLGRKAEGILKKINKKMAAQQPEPVQPDPDPVQPDPNPVQPDPGPATPGPATPGPANPGPATPGPATPAPNGSLNGGVPPTGIPTYFPPPPPPKKRTIGLYFGMSIANFSGSDVDTDANTGVALGGAYTKTISKRFDMLFEGQLVQRGATQFLPMFGSFSFDTSYLDFLFGGRINLGTRFYGETGLALSLLVSDSVSSDAFAEDPEPDTTPADLQLSLGGGMRFGGFDIRLRHMIGAIPVNSDRGGDIGNDAVFNRATLLQGGYWF